jgi:predicted nucleotidyltransferase
MRILDEQPVTIDEHDRQILLACRGAACSVDPSAQIILYGSRARGQAGPESDMDVLVLLDQMPSSSISDAIHDKIYDIGLEADIVISVIIRSRQQWESPLSQATPYYKNIQREGILAA